MKKGSEVLMYDGTVRKVENLLVGDRIMGDDSEERVITSLFNGIGQLYKIIPNDSTEPYYVTNQQILCLRYQDKPGIGYEATRLRYNVNYFEVYTDYEDDHPLSKVKIRLNSFPEKKYENNQAKVFAEEKLKAVELQLKNIFPLHESYMEDILKRTSLNDRLILYRTSVEFKVPVQLDMDPYLVGMWLGDGTSVSPAITNIDQEIIDYIYEEAERMNLKITQGKNTEFNRGDMTYSFVQKGKPINGGNIFRNFLKDNNLMDNKHIPYSYKVSSKKDRLALLAGLIDSDGHYSIEGVSYEIFQKNKTLAEDIVFLARSLGFWCHIRPCIKGCLYKGVMQNGLYYRMTFGGYGLDEIPVLLERKTSPKILKDKHKNPTHYQFKVEKDEISEYYGFEITGNNFRYVMSDYTVIHQSIQTLPIDSNNTVGKRDKSKNIDSSIAKEYIRTLFTLEGDILQSTLFTWTRCKKFRIVNKELYNVFTQKYGINIVTLTHFSALLNKHYTIQIYVSR